MVLIVSTIFLIIQLIIITISYLEYGSIIKIEIIDQNFDKIGLPPIQIRLNRLSLLRTEGFNRTVNSSVHQKKCLEKLHELYFEFKKWNVFNCEIINNGVYEDCDKYIDPMVHIYSEYDMFGKSDECISGSPIQILNQFHYIGFSYFEYFVSNQTNIFSKINLNGKLMKQTDFLRFHTNSTINSETYFSLGINDDYEIAFFLRDNTELSLDKKSFELLEFPYKSKCSYYDRSEKPFGSSSHRHCFRQCIIYHCQIKLNCSCSTLGNRVYETDYGSNDLNFCSQVLYRNYTLDNLRRNYEKLCTDLCPIDCIQNQYDIIKGRTNRFSLLDQSLFKLTLNWDESKPFMIYKETPVMTFTSYFCYIGGLFGIWFGISANQLYDYLIEKRFMLYFYCISSKLSK